MTELQEKIIELRQQGKGQKAIAKQLGCTRDVVRRMCEKHNLNGFIAKQPLSEEEIIYKVKNATQHFEYIGGWESCDKDIYMQCRWCGNMFKHSAQFTKKGHSNPECRNCLDIAKAYEKSERKERKKELRRERKEQRKEDKYWQSNFSQLTVRVCKVCNQLFIPTKDIQKYCSKRCATIRYWKYKDAYRYKIDLELLFKRDKGICHVCGRVCDWNDWELKKDTIVYGNNYPSRDHVIPKSQGGAHIYDNMKLAHRLCNSLRYWQA